MIETEFINWLEDRIKINKEKSRDQNESFEKQTFHLGGSLAFELALEEFKRLFKKE